mgnify:CR=1 FL=1
MTEAKYQTFHTTEALQTNGMESHFCIVCKKDHEDDDWRWTEIKIKGKKKFYCHHGINCAGCKEIHYNNTYLTKIKYEDGKKIEICGKWFGSKPSMAQKVSNMSPQEVMSGVHLGMDEQKGLFRKETLRDDHSILQKRAIKELKEKLS